MFIVLRSVLALTTHQIVPSHVSASSSRSSAEAPANVVDRSTPEPLGIYNYWMPAGKRAAWIQLDLPREYRLERVELLNTGMRCEKCGTREFRIEVSGRKPFTVSGQLPRYPEWYAADLPRVRATSVRIHLLNSWGSAAGLNEVVLKGRPARGVGRYLDEIAAALGALLVLAGGPRLASRWKAALSRERAVFALTSVVLVVFGLHLLRFSASFSTFDWERLFEVSEFDSFERAAAFFVNLRVPIPPLLAAVEMADYGLTGNIDFVTKTIYRACIVLGYCAALALAYPSVGHMLLTCALSLVFIAGTSAVHAGNPQIYDVVYPALSMVFLALLSRALQAGDRSRAPLLFAAGLCLSAATLTRPYAIAVTVLSVVLVVRRMPASRRHVRIFCLATALLAVPWHLQLWLRFGQPTLSNHAGFNLQRAWPMVPEPPLLEEQGARSEHWNNPQHLENSNRLRNAIIVYALEHPIQSLSNVCRRLNELTEPQVVVMRGKPSGSILPIYQLAVRLASLLALVAAVQRAYLAAVSVALALRRRGRPRAERRRPGLLDDLLLGTVAICLLVLAVGEAGEDGRFIVSVLPMLAALPRLAGAALGSYASGDRGARSDDHASLARQIERAARAPSAASGG